MMAMTELTKPKTGRPSTYDPALCDKIEGMGKLGLSRWQIASRLEIAPNNLRNWEGAHEAFRAALEIARLDALDYYETLAQKHMIENPGGPKLNTGLWSRSMAARVPAEYRENSKVEVTGKNDGAIEVDVVHDFAQSLVTDLLAARQADAEAGDSK
jgi:hypothetical protein